MLMHEHKMVEVPSRTSPPMLLFGLLATFRLAHHIVAEPLPRSCNSSTFHTARDITTRDKHGI